MGANIGSVIWKMMTTRGLVGDSLTQDRTTRASNAK